MPNLSAVSIARLQGAPTAMTIGMPADVFAQRQELTGRAK